MGLIWERMELIWARMGDRGEDEKAVLVVDDSKFRAKCNLVCVACALLEDETVPLLGDSGCKAVGCIRLVVLHQSLDQRYTVAHLVEFG